MMKPYYQEPNLTLYQGHTLTVLQDMETESVDCVITSPPYWGLRSYKTEPQIWDNHSMYICDNCGIIYVEEMDGTLRILPQEKNITEKPTPVLQQEMCCQISRSRGEENNTIGKRESCAREESKLEGKDDEKWVSVNQSYGESSLQRQAGVCDGTQTSNGEIFRQILEAKRESPSYKRNKDRQSVRKSSVSGSATSLRVGDLPPLSEKISHSINCLCGGHLVSYKCEHQWVSREWLMYNGRGDAQKSGKYSTQEAIPDAPASDNTCLKCNAWRGELGLEPTIQLYLSHLLQIFNEVRRVLKKTGTCFVNLGDSYSGSGGTGNQFRQIERGLEITKPAKAEVPAKSLCAIPERFMLAMIDSGWAARNDIIWYKSNPMPESVKDRFTGTYEHIYFFVKNKKYWFEQQFEQQVSELKPELVYGNRFGGQGNYPKGDVSGFGTRIIQPNPLGRNKRDVWEINTQPYPEAHFATFPEDLVKTPILAGCPKDGTALDIFAGSGTTLAVAKKLGRKSIGIELNPKYCELVIKRIQEIPIPMELNI